MRKWHILAVALLCAGGVFSVGAQDMIILKNGNVVEAKVTEITPSEIKYKRTDNLNGPTVVIGKSEVLSIRYQNGTVETISGTAPGASSGAFPADLVGRWTYRLAGHSVTYIFTADGKMTAEADGEKSPNPPSDVTVVGNTLHLAHPNGLSGTGQYRIQKGVLTFSNITGQPGFSAVGKFKKE